MRTTSPAVDVDVDADDEGLEAPDEVFVPDEPDEQAARARTAAEAMRARRSDMVITLVVGDEPSEGTWYLVHAHRRVSGIHQVSGVTIRLVQLLGIHLSDQRSVDTC
jgi:hypothetical protein